MTSRPLPWPSPDGARPASVCIVRLSAIGDVVQTLPLAAALKEAWPETRLTWVTQPIPAKVLEGSPVVDEIILFHRRRGVEAVREYREFRGRMAGRHFDLVIAPQVALKAGLLLPLLSSSVRLGFDRARASDLQWLFTTHRIPTGPRRHVVDETLEFAQAMGISTGENAVRWPLRLLPHEEEERDRFFDAIPSPACGVILGASNPRKTWPAERWAPVIDALEEQWEHRVLLLGGSSADERAIADQVLDRCRTEPLDLLGDDLRRLTWMLDGCRLVVGPDTGPLHIAVALGKPVVGLYGRTNPNVSGPYGSSRELVVDGYARHPGENYGTSRRYRNDGMARITPRAVLERIGIALGDGGKIGSSERTTVRGTSYR